MKLSEAPCISFTIPYNFLHSKSNFSRVVRWVFRAVNDAIGGVHVNSWSSRSTSSRRGAAVATARQTHIASTAVITRSKSLPTCSID